jgi:CubicO group peptidase (beta-lactamase class C family)
MKNLKALIIILLFVFFIPAILTASAREEKDPSLIARVVDELKSKVPERFKEREIPGMAIAVVDDEKILWQQVLGHTSRSKEKPINPDTIFSIQSMSKSFTALGVLMAVQDGLLDLDEPITTNGTRCYEYLPGLFFQYNGEVLDFRGTIPSYRNVMLIKRK